MKNIILNKIIRIKTYLATLNVVSWVPHWDPQKYMNILIYLIYHIQPTLRVWPLARGLVCIG